MPSLLKSSDGYCQALALAALPNQALPDQALPNQATPAYEVETGAGGFGDGYRLPSPGEGEGTTKLSPGALAGVIVGSILASILLLMLLAVLVLRSLKGPPANKVGTGAAGGRRPPTPGRPATAASAGGGHSRRPGPAFTHTPAVQAAAAAVGQELAAQVQGRVVVLHAAGAALLPGCRLTRHSHQALSLPCPMPWCASERLG
ncbi:hypothetical protein HaLaN_16123 [Haematococcus lacustris]|uniref:Uncharacterized protein n=1 Tax=Haematococcus lacustris TaxID=44745 RepID=A0A699ZAN3_HAELA|nr:hypothetical protein HaLaN_16123 [Haematococcus lacustris]